MISVNAESFILPLRSIRTALRDHNTHLGASLATLAAEAELDMIIGVIEHASSLFSEDPAPSQACVGAGCTGSHQHSRCVSSIQRPDSS